MVGCASGPQTLELVRNPNDTPAETINCAYTPGKTSRQGFEQQCQAVVLRKTNDCNFYMRANGAGTFLCFDNNGRAVGTRLQP